VIYRCSHPTWQEMDFSSLKYFMYGAAPMSVEKLKQASRSSPGHDGAMQTEAPASISYLPPGEHFVTAGWPPTSAVVRGHPTR